MAELLNITHNDGTLDEYDCVIIDGGDLSADTPGLAGTTAKMEALVDDTTSIYGEKTFTWNTRFFRLRYYIDPNGYTQDTGSGVDVVTGHDEWGGIKFENSLRWNGSNHTIEADVEYEGGTYTTAGYVISDDEHCIEVLWTRATSDVAADGELKLWIDDVLKETISNIDLYDEDRWDRIRVGVQYPDANDDGTIFLDEIVANDDGSEIGPISAAAALPILTDQAIHSLVFGGVTVR